MAYTIEELRAAIRECKVDGLDTTLLEVVAKTAIRAADKYSTGKRKRKELLDVEPMLVKIATDWQQFYDNHGYSPFSANPAADVLITLATSVEGQMKHRIEYGPEPSVVLVSGY